jgi:phosphohistidine swiveling domain-containing protein
VFVTPAIGAKKSSGAGDISGSVLQKSTDLTLDIRDLIKAQMRITNDDRLTGEHMLVDEHLLVATLHGTKHFFSLKHEGKNVDGVLARGIIFSDQAAQKSLGIVLGHSLWSSRCRRLVFGTPKRKRLYIVIPILPSLLAEILAAEALTLANQERVKVIAISKFVSRASARVSA